MSPVVPAHRFVAIVAALGLAVAACSSSQSTPSSVASGTSQTATSETTEAAEAIETAVAVTIEEWAVRPATDSIPAGNVTFGVTNAGPRYGHEFLVVKTDLDPAALPIRSNGVLRESEAGIEVVDEIGIEVGATRELIATLAAGKYVLLCNIYDDAGSHLSQGMLTVLTVTE